MDSLITGIEQNISVIIITVNAIFCLIIIFVGLFANINYKEVINSIEKLKSIYNVFKGLQIEYQNENEVIDLWKKIKNQLELDDINEEQRKILLQGVLNEEFNPIAEKLKKANSQYESLSTLGLLGTVLGLSIGALFTKDISKIHIMMSCFQTALFTTLFGLICQLLIKWTNNDVKAETTSEDLQGKIEELSNLCINGHLPLTKEYLENRIKVKNTKRE